MSRGSTTLESVLARVKRTPEGCWEWTGCKTRNAASGYGVVGYQGQNWLVHRLMYTLIRGEIPEGKEIDHLCRNRICCNPEHLEAVTASENQNRGLNGVLKTHCPKGHEYSGDNVFVDNRGRRNCRVCHRENSRKQTLKEREKRIAEGTYQPKSEFKTHCPKGHAYTPENTLVVSTTGERQCRECGRNSAMEQYRKLSQDPDYREKKRQAARAYYYANHEAELEKRRQRRLKS